MNADLQQLAHVDGWPAPCYNPNALLQGLERGEANEMQFFLDFTESAWGDLGFFRKYEQNIITEVFVMKTIELTAAPPRTEDVLQLAEGDGLVVRTPNGKAFLIAEMDRGDEAEDDFAEEVALARGNKALRELLADRSRESGRYSLEQVREKLGLKPL